MSSKDKEDHEIQRPSINTNVERMFALKSATAETQVRLGVGVFVLDDSGKFLLERRSDCGMWGLPGGRVEPGESVRTAAIREVQEETGYIVEISRFIGVYSDPSDRIITYPDNGDIRHLVDIIIESKVISGTLTCSSESFELRFFNCSNLPDNIVPPARLPIYDYINGNISVVK
jgi:ADP-ribose pyrophosphatase YjhB (NUDIX family)